MSQVLCTVCMDGSYNIPVCYEVSGVTNSL